MGATECRCVRRDDYSIPLLHLYEFCFSCVVGSCGCVCRRYRTSIGAGYSEERPAGHHQKGDIFCGSGDQSPPHHRAIVPISVACCVLMHNTSALAGNSAYAADWRMSFDGRGRVTGGRHPVREAESAEGRATEAQQRLDVPVGGITLSRGMNREWVKVGGTHVLGEPSEKNQSQIARGKDWEAGFKMP